MTILTYSDLLSGGLYELYNMVIKKQGFSSMPLIEQVVYRVGGRQLQVITGTSLLDTQYIKNGDLYCGIAAGLDGHFRLRENVGESVQYSARSVIASAAANILIDKIGVGGDKTIF